MLDGLERVAGPTTARDIEALAGNLLRRARKARGLELSEVAAAAQVPHALDQGVASTLYQGMVNMLYQAVAASGAPQVS